MSNSRHPAPPGLGGAVLLAAVLTWGCSTVAVRGAAPALEPGRGTLSGSVTAVLSRAPITDCVVEAVELETADRYAERCAATGHYALLVPPGRYRLGVVLPSGEALVERPPDVVEVDPSELMTGLNFVVGETVARR